MAVHINTMDTTLIQGISSRSVDTTLIQGISSRSMIYKTTISDSKYNEIVLLIILLFLFDL